MYTFKDSIQRLFEDNFTGAYGLGVHHQSSAVRQQHPHSNYCFESRRHLHLLVLRRIVLRDIMRPFVSSVAVDPFLLLYLCILICPSLLRVFGAFAALTTVSVFFVTLKKECMQHIVQQDATGVFLNTNIE